MGDINSQYDDIVQAYPLEVRDAIIQIEKRLEKENCKFGDTIVPFFLKPVFLSEDEVNSLCTVLDHITNILNKITKAYFTNPELRDYFYLDKRGEELINIDPGFSRSVVICRPDSFIADGHIRFVEFNCDSPAGAGYADIQESIFKKSFCIEKLSKTFLFKPHARSDALLKALLSAYKEFAGNNKKPNIAILDWKDVKTRNEFEILAHYFKNKGYNTVIADPRDIKLVNGCCECNEFPIDLVYRRVIFRELMEKHDEVQDFLEAYRQNKVCVVNPLRSRLASNKAILAILTNPKKYSGFFTEEENKVITAHIPWTRRVLDIQAVYEGNKDFLRKHIVNHQRNLVLKPADSYGGKDVIIGRECPPAHWEALLNRILGNREDWVVQRYVNITQMTVPALHPNGAMEFKSKKYNINPFVFGGKYAGSIARCSDQSVINVSAGGGLVPVIEYAEK